jgi:HlyD family secretion protein
MRQNKKHSRLVLTVAAIVLVGGALATMFWPRALLVDMATVRTGALVVTINEEGRTQVQEPYVVSTPVAGELQRVTVLPGDKVIKGVTVVAQMLPSKPSALDVRTREQARAVISAAEAALRLAGADLNAAMANRDFANSELDRSSRLVERKISSRVTMERAKQAARVSDANVDTAEAAIAMREAELDRARAQLIGFDDAGLAIALKQENNRLSGMPLLAPIDGTILKLIHKSETALPAGQPILEIGDVEGDLEIVAELLSSDAVQVEPDNRVIITNWGGTRDLAGTVSRIDPYGYTKHSALGVEEQRVETIIHFDDPESSQGKLGHGYRVEVRIVVWESKDTAIVPSGALFRQSQDWAVFKVVDGRAVLQVVQIGQNNGVDAQLLGGLEPEEEVILFPSANIDNGQLVTRRRIE